MEEKKIYSLLSLCRKAGKARSGEQTVLNCISSGEARLIIIARDASANTSKRFQDKSEHRGIPVVRFGTMEELGHAMGMSERAGVAVTDGQFAGAMKERITALESREGVSNGED